MRLGFLHSVVCNLSLGLPPACWQTERALGVQPLRFKLQNCQIDARINVFMKPKSKPGQAMRSDAGQSLTTANPTKTQSECPR